MGNNFINVDKLIYVKKFPAIESELYTFEKPIFDKKGFYYCYGCRYVENYIGTELTEDLLKEYFIKDNIVYHVIAGVNELSILSKIKESPVKKCLILGYKQYGRGETYYSEEVKNCLEDWSCNLGQYIKKIHLSFDNLSLKQLNIKQYLTDEEWDKFYCGTDGAFTMYIDAVEQKYAMSSTNPNKYDLVGDIKSIFSNINSQVKQ